MWTSRTVTLWDTGLWVLHTTLKSASTDQNPNFWRSKKLHFRKCQGFVWFLCCKLQLTKILLRSSTVKGFLPKLQILILGGVTVLSADSKWWKDRKLQEWTRRGESVSVVVQSLSRAQLFAISWTAAHQASLSFINYQRMLKLMSIQSVMPSNHLILCWPLLLLPSILSSIRVFSNESALHIR